MLPETDATDVEMHEIISGVVAHPATREVKGREPLTDYLKTMPKREQRQAHVAFLDAQGKLIAKFDSPKVLKMGAPALLKEMRKARKENDKRQAKAKKKLR